MANNFDFNGKLLINSNGNVLIGTTTDVGATLYVNGSGLFSSNLQTNGVLTIGNQSVAGNYFLSITPSTTVPVALQGVLAGTGAAAISMQASGGNVLIGTTTDPGYKLFVNGSIVNNTNINSTGDAGLLITPGLRLGFDESGVRSWNVKATGGNLAFNSGDGNGSFTFGASVTASSLIKSGGTSSQYLMADGSVSTIQTANVYTQTFFIPDTSGTAQWVKVGTWTAAQGGQVVTVEIAGHAGYNATTGQNQSVYIYMKTSNGSSVDPNGFAADSSFYTQGLNTTIGAGNVIWEANSAGVSATTYTLYVLFGQFTNGSQYTVTSRGGTWANVGTLTAPSGTTSSSTILLSEFRYVANNQLLTLDGNSSVLIGTTTNAGYKLDVNGTARIVGNAYTTGEFGIELTWSGNTLNDNRIGRIRPISTSSQNPYAGGLAFDYYKYDGSTYTWFEGMRLAGSGNVGIGTTSPQSRFHVETPASNPLRMVRTGDASYGFEIGSGDSGFYNYGTSSYVWYAKANGNVLIGTTTDAGYKLRVSGQGYFDSVVTMYTGFTSYTPDGLFSANALYGSVFTPSGNSRIRLGYFDQGGGQYWGRIGFNGSTNWNIGTAAGGESFQIGIGNDSSAALLINNAGQVGIGTTNPTAQLQVNGNFRLYTTNNDSNELRGIFNVGGTADPLSFSMYKADATTVGTFLTADGDSFFNGGNVGIGTTSPAANAKLTIDGSAGANTSQIDMVGYSSTAKGHLGQFSNNLYLSTNYYYSGGQYNDTAALGQAAIVLSAGATTTSFIDFNLSDAGANNPSSKVRIAANGNVLIGTTTDDGSRLRVDGGRFYVTNSIAYSAYIVQSLNTSASDFDETLFLMNSFQSDSAYSAIGMSTNGTDGQHHRVTLKAFRDTAGGNTGGQLQIFLREAGTSFNVSRVTFRSNGNVGIGTTAPSAKLDVNAGEGSAGFNKGINILTGNGTFTAGHGGILQFQNEDVITAGIRGVRDPGSWASSLLFYTHTSASGNTFGTTFTEKMRITDGGNVLIGTTTDGGYKLRVNGEILADDDIRILNTFALVLNGTDNNWRIGRNTISDSGWLTDNTMQMVVFGSQSGQGFQVVNHNGTALFEIDGVAGASRFTNALGVGVNPSGTAGRIDASNDIVAYSSSDLRLKENIKPIENALDKVKALTGVEFDWKAEHKEAHGYEGHDTGIIAQEVQEVMPTAVRTNDTGYLAVRYEKLIGLLIEANKELADQVANQQVQIDELKKLIK